MFVLVIPILVVLWVLLALLFGSLLLKEEFGIDIHLPKIQRRRRMYDRPAYEDYEAFEKRIEIEAGIEATKIRKGHWEARNLEKSANDRLMKTWDTQFIREARIREIWEARRDEWAKKALAFKNAQKDIRDLPVYWVLGRRSYDANTLIDLLKGKENGWHLSLYLQNCNVVTRDENLLELKAGHARSIRDEELVSFVMNDFNYEKLSKYEPYFGTEKTQLDRYFEDQAVGLLEFKKEPIKKPQVIEAEPVELQPVNHQFGTVGIAPTDTHVDMLKVSRHMHDVVKHSKTNTKQPLRSQQDIVAESMKVVDTRATIDRLKRDIDALHTQQKSVMLAGYDNKTFVNRYTSLVDKERVLRRRIKELEKTYEASY